MSTRFVFVNAFEGLDWEIIDTAEEDKHTFYLRKRGDPIFKIANTREERLNVQGGKPAETKPGINGNASWFFIRALSVDDTERVKDRFRQRAPAVAAVFKQLGKGLMRLTASDVAAIYANEMNDTRVQLFVAQKQVCFLFPVYSKE